jgi:hypothetical protein
MRNLGSLSLSDTNNQIKNKIGRIALFLLLLIITVLVYGKAEAKETNNTEEDLLINQIQNQAKEQEELFIPKETTASLDLDTKENNDLALELKAQIKEETVLVTDEELREDIKKELTGTRMEPMIDYISTYERQTAALIVGIAKSESGYKHNYQNNFWGYAGGYFAFESPKEAVMVVGKRIEELKNKGLDTPGRIVTTWKCGRSCAAHAPGSVQRWISTASGPYNRIALNK